jgi:membrane protease YdiL (CAAX protease family)
MYYDKSPFFHAPINNMLIENTSESTFQNDAVLTKEHYLEIANRELKARLGMGTFVVFTLTALAIYNYLIELVVGINKHLYTTTYTTAGMLILFSALMFVMIKKTGRPLKDFGFNANNWLRNSAIAIIISIVFCILLTLLIWLLITQVNTFSGLRLILPPAEFFGSYKSWLTILVYIIFIPLQVFIAHSALQSPLMLFLPPSKSIGLSTLVTPLVFGAIHTDLELAYALAVLLPAFLWCFMYARFKSLVPIIVSHVIIGVWCLWFLPLRLIFHIISTSTTLFL